MEWPSLISIRAALNDLMLGFDNDFDDGFSLEGRVCLVFKKIEGKKIYKKKLKIKTPNSFFKYSLMNNIQVISIHYINCEFNF